MTNEEICTKFMHEFYDDQHLSALLEHAEDGKLVLYSCCCFVGAANADHPLQSGFDINFPSFHYVLMHENNSFTSVAEEAFGNLGKEDSERRAAIIPLIRAEMARRDALRPNPDFSRSPLGKSIIEASRRVSRENIAHEQGLMAASGCNEDGDGSGE